MSNITLYFFPEINERDTPIFDTLENQRGFFDDLERCVVPDNSFYVPKFKDEIVLSSDDVDFKSSFSYLSLRFNEKDYYYFIKSIEYRSETEVKITIEMDVIQTYMFDIQIYSGELVKESIKRWEGNLINRNYIRENLSNAPFVQSDRVNLKSTEDFTYEVDRDFSLSPRFTSDEHDLITGFIIARCTTAISQGGTPWPKRCDAKIIGINPGIETSSYRYILIPLINGRLTTDDYTIESPDQADNTEYIRYNFRAQLEELANNSNAVQALYYIPFNPFADIKCYYGTLESNVEGAADITANFVWINRDKLHISQYISPGSNDSSADEIVTLNVDYLTKSYSFDFVKNTSRSAPFSVRFIPALLDENYYRISFGEGAELATMQLYQLTGKEVYCNYYSDFISGYRVYTIEPLQTNTTVWNLTGFGDVFYNTTTSGNLLTIDLLTNEWKEFYAYNKYSFMSAIGKTAVKAFASSAGPVGYETAKAVVGKNDGTLRSAMDAALAPNSARQMGNAFFDLNSESALVSLSIYNVQDLEECGQKLEADGYKVHRFVSGNLRSFNNRFYYDVIQFDSLNIGLLTIQDRDTLNIIKERMQNGLRLWHTTNGSFNFDTVEGVSMVMGQVCVYDNVEN